MKPHYVFRYSLLFLTYSLLSIQNALSDTKAIIYNNIQASHEEFYATTGTILPISTIIPQFAFPLHVKAELGSGLKYDIGLNINQTSELKTLIGTRIENVFSEHFSFDGTVNVGVTANYSPLKGYNYSPTLETDFVFLLKNQGYVQSYSNIIFNDQSKYYQKFAWAIPVLDSSFKIGPYTGFQIERSEKPHYYNGLFITGLKLWSLELIPSIGVHTYSKNNALDLNLYTKIQF